jgi:hypothetical protein
MSANIAFSITQFAVPSPKKGTISEEKKNLPTKEFLKLSFIYFKKKNLFRLIFNHFF